VTEKNLADQDPDRIVSVSEACKILGISKPTLYRHGLARTQLSPGRVGYRVGDLLEHLHSNGGIGSEKFNDFNFVVVNPGEQSIDTLQGIPRNIRIVQVRRSPSHDANRPATIWLPPAARWGGHREMIIIDYDGLGAIKFVPAEGEHIGRQTEWTYLYAYGLARLQPLLSDESEPDGWWVA
jgi:hypothetical protein